MVFPQYAFSIEPTSDANSVVFGFSNSTQSKTSMLDLTSTSIVSNLDTANQGSHVSYTVKVTDTSNLASIPAGSVTWSDGNIGGTFSPSSCTLSSGSCAVTYTPPSNYGGTVTITGSYGGDDSHSGSSGTSTLTVTVLHGVTTTITSSASTLNQGSQVQLTATLADTTNSPLTPTGSVTWNDGNLGGSFNPTSCTLSSGKCAVTYTPPVNYGGSIVVNTIYNSDYPFSKSAGTFTLMVNLLPNTSTTITPNTAQVNQGSQVQFTATVTDTSNSQNIPTGTVTWSDGNLGGTFNPSSCILSSGSCAVTYTPSTKASNSVTVTATFAANNGYSGSAGMSSLTVNALHTTTTTVTPNTVSMAQGSKMQFTATLADVSISSIVSGDVTWSDGNAGGTFDQASCTLSSNTCAVYYTAPASSTNAVTITATYGGDSSHSSSVGTSTATMIVLPSSLLLSTDQSYYAYGDVVTLSVNLPGQSMQSIAVGVSNPSGDNIISRTITTDENGTGSLQFKIPNTYQTGVYQDIVTATVYGKSYTNSTEFNVIRSHGISIDSVQITNQQGNPVSILPKGQNGFVKVSISSGEKMPALLTLNLFDANQSSLGTTSIKSIVNPGTSQMTLSFFIPSNVQVGLANVFTDVYSDWPTNGGTPLTAESCLAADLQDTAILPVSYVPPQPHSCTTSSSGLPGIGSVISTAMTNNKAEVTLGVVIQNDSMIFMSPTQAHLLALAYENSTGQNAKNNSVGLVNVDLASLDANVNAGTVNATKIGPTQFTTLAGPDLQNNPMAMKILQEIEASKKQVANIIGNQTAAKLDQQLVLQQRQAAASQLKQDLTTLVEASASTTPDVAYANFLTTVSDNRTHSVFQDEFNFMKQRIAVANTAMRSVIDNGGSIGQAVATFNKYATINHVQMVTLNSELNVAYGLADSRIQSCFDNKGQLTVVNGVNQCVADIQNNSTGPTGIAIISVQPTDQQGNPVSLIQRGQMGYVKVVIDSGVHTQSLVTVNIFDSDVSSLGTESAQYTLSPGQSEVVLPYYVPSQSGTGLASVYANVFTDWPNKGGTSQTHEQSYFVGLS
ncbi:MAG: hypothetical protein KGI10_00200 [Thaumarchaeota archaeon]|nr:hypothetical protein [Nitrososphaerota archaeon]